MKKIIIATLAATILSSTVTGLTVSKFEQRKAENLVNMEYVTDVKVTETGILLEFSDGTGYYWER